MNQTIPLRALPAIIVLSALLLLPFILSHTVVADALWLTRLGESTTALLCYFGAVLALSEVADTLLHGKLVGLEPASHEPTANFASARRKKVGGLLVVVVLTLLALAYDLFK